ncbi:exosome complex component rrp41 [Anaeramoeba ignava]|uniref:Exosome complex component rrp41 n=1 Tax=Anaeramoeba ignava TaxID=1746090 RepID=A0A9Q0RGD3_ANAIG|nr:exosome complex component rrp41 [Anaeramoeba ignava]
MEISEYVNPEGLRIDGRRRKELRKIEIEMGKLEQVDGSALFVEGFTRVMASVCGPKEVENRSKAVEDKAFISVEFLSATFSTRKRTKMSKKDRRVLEICSIIRKTFEPVLQLELFPESEISIFIQVLQADGGVESACINAVTLALIDAGIPMIDFVCSCTGTYLDSFCILDTNFIEETAGGSILIAAILAKSKKVVSTQMKISRLKMENFTELLELVVDGCSRIYDLMEDATRKRTKEQLNSQTALIK